MRFLNQEMGFTLIEVILVIALISIISSAIFMVFNDSIKVWFFNKERIEVQQNHDIVQRWLERYARQAKEITVAPGGKEVTITLHNLDQYTFLLDNQYFAVKNPDNSIRKISDLKFDNNNFTFTFNNNILEMKAPIKNKKENNIYTFVSAYYPRFYDPAP